MKRFGKQPKCPTSQEILSYLEGSLRPLAGQRVERHSVSCDFCGAELQLLAKYRPTEEDYTPGPTPGLINLLGINLPLGRASAVQRRRAA